jgi:hypothetical protein
MLQTCISFSKKSNAVMLEMFALEQIQPESPEVAILEQKIKTEQMNVMKLLDTVFGH